MPDLTPRKRRRRIFAGLRGRVSSHFPTYAPRTYRTRSQQHQHGPATPPRWPPRPAVPPPRQPTSPGTRPGTQTPAGTQPPPHVRCAPPAPRVKSRVPLPRLELIRRPLPPLTPRVQVIVNPSLALPKAALGAAPGSTPERTVPPASQPAAAIVNQTTIANSRLERLKLQRPVVLFSQHATDQGPTADTQPLEPSANPQDAVRLSGTYRSASMTITLGRNMWRDCPTLRGVDTVHWILSRAIQGKYRTPTSQRMGPMRIT